MLSKEEGLVRAGKRPEDTVTRATKIDNKLSGEKEVKASPLLPRCAWDAIST